MEWIIIFCMVSLAAVKCETDTSTPLPSTNGDCSEDEAEKMFHCSTNTNNSPESKNWQDEVDKVICKCFPEFKSTECQEKNDNTDKCFMDIELAIGSDKSMSVDQKYKETLALDECAPARAWPLGTKQIETLGANEQLSSAASVLSSFSSMAAIYGGNDTCLPNAEQIKCIVNDLKTNKAVEDLDKKASDAASKCTSSAPESCITPGDNLDPQQCEKDYKPMTDKYEKQVHQCSSKK